MNVTSNGSRNMLISARWAVWEQLIGCKQAIRPAEAEQDQPVFFVLLL